MTWSESSQKEPLCVRQLKILPDQLLGMTSYVMLMQSFFLFFVLLCCFLLVYITINIGRRVTQETKFSLKNLNYITVIVTSVFQNTWVIKTIVLRFLSPVEQNCAKRYLPTINRDQKKIAFNFVQHICQSKFIQCLLIFAKCEYVYGFYLTSVSNNSAYQTNSKQAACIRIDIRSCR